MTPTLHNAVLGTISTAKGDKTAPPRVLVVVAHPDEHSSRVVDCHLAYRVRAVDPLGRYAQLPRIQRACQRRRIRKVAPRHCHQRRF